MGGHRKQIKQNEVHLMDIAIYYCNLLLFTIRKQLKKIVKDRLRSELGRVGKKRRKLTIAYKQRSLISGRIKIKN